MARRSGPLFLARAVYRQRRLRDAARLLPVVGLFLLHVPLLWGGVPFGASDAHAVYVFAVWALLIAAAAALAPQTALRDGNEEGGEGSPGPEAQAQDRFEGPR